MKSGRKLSSKCVDAAFGNIGMILAVLVFSLVLSPIAKGGEAASESLVEMEVAAIQAKVELLIKAAEAGELDEGNAESEFFVVDDLVNGLRGIRKWVATEEFTQVAFPRGKGKARLSQARSDIESRLTYCIAILLGFNGDLPRDPSLNDKLKLARVSLRDIHKMIDMVEE